MPLRSPAAQTTNIPLLHVFPAWGVDVMESHHAEEWRMESTNHDFLKLVLVHQGHGALVTNEEEIPCSPGDILVVPIGQFHHLEDRHGDPMSLYIVSIRRSVLDIAALDPSRVPGGRLELDRALAGKIEGAVRRMLFEQTLDQAQSGAVVVSLALRMVAELMRVDERSETQAQGYSTRDGRGDSVSRVRSYVEDLEDHFFEATNLDAAAASLGLSRRRFTQLFRELTGASWLTYLRRLRVGHARRLLDQTSRTVLSIAFECGFEDLSTFYRAFKREVGVSPNQWRTRVRDAN